MSIFVTSDTHFNHANIIKLCNRPFKNVKEMDEGIIAAWNKVVGERDTVYHLGDFCWGNEDSAKRYLKQLNGRIYFLLGNHDVDTLSHFYHWGECPDTKTDYAQVIGPNIIEVNKFVLCHYPLREWNGMYKGAIHLYGHVHNNLTPLPNSFDVTTDASLAPRRLEEFIK